MLVTDEKARIQIYITVSLPTNKKLSSTLSYLLICKKNRGILHELGHIIFLRDLIIFHMLFLVSTCCALYYCCKIHPFVVHHFKIDICGFLITRYSVPLWVGVQAFTSTFNVVQIKLCFDSPNSKKVLEIFPFGSQLRFTLRHVLWTPRN
jgi:hypothetical protein